VVEQRLAGVEPVEKSDSTANLLPAPSTNTEIFIKEHAGKVTVDAPFGPYAYRLGNDRDTAGRSCSESRIEPTSRATLWPRTLTRGTVRYLLKNDYRVLVFAAVRRRKVIGT
jgi:hypothetical protein